jgi:hypothetical protein
MNKKLLITILISSTILLSGCFGSEEGGGGTIPTPENISNDTKTYTSNELSLQFPASWDLIDPKDFSSAIPPETEVALRNNIKNDTYTANINIVKNPLQTDKTSLDYAKEVLNRQRTGMLDYKETKREIINVIVGGQKHETYYTEFEARLNQTDPVIKFVQTYAVKDKAGFIAMGAYSLQENTVVVEQVNSSVKTLNIN